MTRSSTTGATMALLLSLSWLLLLFSGGQPFASAQLVGTPISPGSSLTCSIDPAERDAKDPALQEISFDIGDGPETFLAYVQPNVTSFYRGEAPADTPVVPKHKGLAAMFVNLSNQRVRVYWEAYRGSTPSLIDVLKPFGKGGTASFPGHRFFISYEEDDDPEEVQIRFIVGKPPNNIHVFDPYYVEDDEEATAANLEILDEEELELYNGMRKTLRFNEVYREATGRSYLANYPKKPSDHHMWRADYFGQTHWTTTRETHFTSMPPSDSLGYISTHGRARVLAEDDPRSLAEYRSGEPFLNMTLRVMSCAPRVFEIRNFLSPTEVEHILNVAAGEELSASTTGIGNDFEREEDATRRTRSSFNSWIERERSPILDAVYRRAADLLHIDESLFRRRDKDERPDLEDRNTISESLQLVHYDIGQEYTAHHDFGYSDQDSEHQSQRYCTLLLYLNEGMSGGSTSFPRWVNAETFEELRAIPEVGKAVLFYNQLPDGNPDDLSQHQANPIYDGEKWLINLWVWSPYHK